MFLPKYLNTAVSEYVFEIRKQNSVHMVHTIGKNGAIKNRPL